MIRPPTDTDINLIISLNGAFATTSALEVAERLDILSKLRSRPTDLTGLVRECSLDTPCARVLLGALASLGLVELDSNGAYRATDIAVSLVPFLRNYWNGLDERIRAGRAMIEVDTALGAELFYPGTVTFLSNLFRHAAKLAAVHLAKPNQRVLDLGAGAATWSLAIAVREPSCQVTALDLPPVLDTTRQAICEAGVVRQFTLVGGDFFSSDLGRSTFDLAIAGNVCHLFGETGNRSLLSKLQGALCPGGTIAIMDAVPNEQLDGPKSVMLYALGLMLRTRTGQVYPFSSYAAWLCDAGFERVERLELTRDPPVTLITARRS